MVELTEAPDAFAQAFIDAAMHDASERARGEPSVFVSLIFAAIIARFTGTTLMTDDAFRHVSSEVRRALSTMRQHGLSSSALIFSGLAITGVKLSATAENSVTLRWEVDFFPGPIYVRHFGDCTPLGTFRDYDLYIGKQGLGQPSTLIARSGDSATEYAMWNPTLAGTLQLYSDDAPIILAFREAYERACTLGESV